MSAKRALLLRSIKGHAQEDNIGAQPDPCLLCRDVRSHGVAVRRRSTMHLTGRAPETGTPYDLGFPFCTNPDVQYLTAFTMFYKAFAGLACLQGGRGLQSATQGVFTVTSNPYISIQPLRLQSGDFSADDFLCPAKFAAPRGPSATPFFSTQPYEQLSSVQTAPPILGIVRACPRKLAVRQMGRCEPRLE